MLCIGYLLSQNPKEFCNSYPNIILGTNGHYPLLPFDFYAWLFDLRLRITGIARPSPASLSMALSSD